MSHFVVNVIVPAKVWAMGETKVNEYLETKLEPYYEGRETPRYRKYTKQELIDKGREEIMRYKNGTYAEYKKDPKAYKANCSNERHITYVSKEFPLKLKWTDEQVYEDQIRYYEPDEIGKEGEVYSTYNPNSKWDWWVIGGRWCGWLTDKEKELETDNGFNFNSPRTVDVNSCTTLEAVEKKKIPFAILTPNNEWIERGEMGWWACVSNEKDEEKWDYEAMAIYQKFPDDYIINIDCHI